MELDERELRLGLKYIVGKWQADFVVSAFSDDLAHIPANEFKSDDGSDFSGISFEFFEDHTFVMKNAANGMEEPGTWEQTGTCEYRYTPKSFENFERSGFIESACTLSVQDGHLVFAIGFLAVALKKVADGVVTEKPDIGDIVPTAEDEKNTAIVGRYEVYKTLSMIGEDFGLFTREEVLADLKARGADDEEIAEGTELFNGIIEFTPDHKVIQWMPVPAGVSEDDIKAALEAGEIKAVSDGYFATGNQEWKSLDGKYYCDSGLEGEVMGEQVSGWEELAEDENGCIPFGGGMMLIRRIK